MSDYPPADDQQPGAWEPPAAPGPPDSFPPPAPSGDTPPAAPPPGFGGYQQPGGYQAPGAYQQPGGYQQPGAYPPPGGYQQPGYGYQQPAYGYQGAVDHPQGTTILVLGILSILCCGLLGPVAWIMGNKAIAEIDARPGAYSNRGSVQAGRIIGIIATVILIITVVGYGLLFAIGAGSSSSSY